MTGLRLPTSRIPGSAAATYGHRVSVAGAAARLGVRVAGPDRRRTASEPLAANDELVRLMLLEVSGERAPAMLRGFPVPLPSGPKTKYSNSGGRDPSRAERQDDHGAIAVESRPGCGVAGGVPVEGL